CGGQRVTAVPTATDSVTFCFVQPIYLSRPVYGRHFEPGQLVSANRRAPPCASRRGRLTVPPVIGEQDIFEGTYTEKFRSLVAAHGELISYERDRSTFDIGVHLTEATQTGRSLSHSRVWFQLKGIRASTLSSEEYGQACGIDLRVSLDHLKFWCAEPGPNYLALYVESVDTFLAEDVRDIVYRQWGESFFGAGTFPKNQKTVTVKLSKDAVLTPARL